MHRTIQIYWYTLANNSKKIHLIVYNNLVLSYLNKIPTSNTAFQNSKKRGVRKTQNGAIEMKKIKESK